MMFWGRGSGGKSSTASATSYARDSRGSSQNDRLQAVATVPASPSYLLSEQRRSELLLAARTTRVSWVDGEDSSNNPLLPTSTNEYPGTLAACAIPSHCREALEGVNAELSGFFASLDELKRKIVANDIPLTEEAVDSTADVEINGRKYYTLFQELAEQEMRLNQWQRSHSPSTRRLTGQDREMAFLVAFRELVDLLKNTQAAELVYRIQSFVKRAELWDLPLMLRAVATRERPGGRVQDFITKLVEQIKHSEKLRKVLQGDEDGTRQQEKMLHVRDPYGVEILHEVLEAFLMEKLYAKMLTPSKEVASQDQAFHERISLLGFVTFKHLDLPIPETEEQEQTWDRLAKQLEALTLCPSPRRKMDGVLRVCQDLTTFLKVQNGGKFPSADGFLPALIYVVLRANPYELKRNVAFILEYRNPTKLVSEPGYFFTHLVSSVAFLEEVNGSRLTISPEEFDEELRRSKERVKRDISREMEHELASNTSSSSGETMNSTTKLLQNERQKQNLPLYGSSTSKEEEEFLRLPTVLEVRARRLETLTIPDKFYAGFGLHFHVFKSRHSKIYNKLRVFECNMPMFHVLVRLPRWKRRTERVVSQSSSEKIRISSALNGSNNEVHRLETGTEQEFIDGNRAVEATRSIKRNKSQRNGMLRWQGGRHVLTYRRQQFIQWKGRATTTVMRTIQGCYPLARREITLRRAHSKVSSSSKDEHKLSEPETESISSTKQPKHKFKHVRSTASISQSITDLVEECRNEGDDSEVTVYTPHVTTLEKKSSEIGIAETSSDSFERQVLSDVLPVNVDDDQSCSSSPHLPYRTTTINGHLHILQNEWV